MNAQELHAIVSKVKREQEEWRDVIGFEGIYSVSDRGDIRSAYRSKKILRPGFARRYHFVALRKDGKSHYKTVHRIVCEAFIGPPPSDSHYVNHKDGNRTNNAVENLEWVTPAENIQHAIYVLKTHDPRCKKPRRPKVDTMKKSWKPHSKLTIEQVRMVRERLASGGRGMGRKLAMELGVAETTISGIKNNKYWTAALAAAVTAMDGGEE